MRVRGVPVARWRSSSSARAGSVWPEKKRKTLKKKKKFCFLFYFFVRSCVYFLGFLRKLNLRKTPKRKMVLGERFSYLGFFLVFLTQGHFRMRIFCKCLELVVLLMCFLSMGSWEKGLGSKIKVVLVKSFGPPCATPDGLSFHGMFAEYALLL